MLLIRSGKTELCSPRRLPPTFFALSTIHLAAGKSLRLRPFHNHSRDQGGDDA